MLRGVVGGAHGVMLRRMHFRVSVLLMGLREALGGGVRGMGVMIGVTREMGAGRIGEGVRGVRG